MSDAGQSTVDGKRGYNEGPSSYQESPPPIGFVQPAPMAPPPYSAELDPKQQGLKT